MDEQQSRDKLLKRKRKPEAPTEEQFELKSQSRKIKFTESQDLENKDDIFEDKSLSNSKSTNSGECFTSENQQLTTEKVQNQADPNKNEFPEYKVRKATINHGKDFEYLLCAYLALKLCNDSNIVDFRITTNNVIYGDFDDVELTVNYADKPDDPHTFLVQLKLSEKRGEITDEMLAGVYYDDKMNKKFNLLKYAKSFNEKLKTKKNITCILATNDTAQLDNISKICMGSEKITSTQYPTNKDKKLSLLDTNQSGRFCFHFTSLDSTGGNTYDAFFKCFYLLTNQNNHEELQSRIEAMLKDRFGCEIEFIRFMQQWSSPQKDNNFVLTRHDVIIKLAELALSQFIQEITPGTVDKIFLEKSKPLKSAIENFEMTLVKNDHKNPIGQIWAETSAEEKEMKNASRKYGISTSGTSQLTSLEHSKVLWFLNKVPLIVKWEEKEDKRIRGALKLLEQEAEKMRIIMLTNKAKEEFPEWQIFETLHDLQNEETCYTEITENFKVSLQGRPSISLKQLIDSNMEITKAIETEQLFLMLREDLCIGKVSQKLPQVYISRNISTLFLDTKKILDYYKSVKKLILIINYTNQFEDALNLRNIETKNLEDFLSDFKSGMRTENKLVILAEDNKCTASNFNEICKKFKSHTIYLLQIIDQNCSTLVLAQRDISSLKKMQFDAITVKEDQFYSFFNNPLNIITGKPGLGKSTLLTYLSQQCPSDCWCVLVKLIEFSSFLRGNHSTNEILDKFLKNECAFFKKIKTEFQQNRKLYLLLDGLDEINSNTVKTVLNFVEEVYSTGIKVWITSRENLKENIIQRLNIFSINIQEVTEEDQRTYIDKRLGNKYVKEEIEEIISGMFQSISISNNVRNILGVPLQLHIITEIFLNDNKETYKKLKNEDIFVLSKMYRTFFRGKEAHQEKKAGTKIKEALNDDFDYKLRQYEMPALKTCLDSEVFNKLKLENSREFKYCEEFLTKRKIKGDKCGIISQVVEQNQTLEAIFAHQSFAEYFTCVWLKNNVDKLRLIQGDFFDVKYENLRLIFDIMLAEDSPLHLATLYKNTGQVEKLYLEHYNNKDEGGRSALHLICSYGAKYESKSNYRNAKRDTTTYIKIFEMLSICNPLESDVLFNWSCLDYAMNCKCLYPFEKCCKKLEKLFECYDKSKLAWICVFCGYSNILKALIEKNRSIVDWVTHSNNSLLMTAVEGYLRTDETKLKEMNIETIKMLIKCGCDVNYVTEFNNSALHIALFSKKCDKNLIEVLLENKADVNMKNYNRKIPLIMINNIKHRHRSPIFVACRYQNNSIVDLLIRNGAKINSKDKRGSTPLHEACKNGTLLAAGADINQNNSIVDLLIRNGAEINSKNILGSTPLHEACKNKTLLAAGADINQNNSIVDLLIRNGAEINSKNILGSTPLHEACKNKTLLAAGADINQNNSIVDLLIRNGAEINSKDKYGSTPLHEACKNGTLLAAGADINQNNSIVDLLIRNGAEINSKDEYGSTPLHEACKNENLLVAGADINQNNSIVDLLIRNGAEMNSKDEDESTPLYRSCEKGICSNVATLLAAGADTKILNNYGNTMLHAASMSANADVIKLLLDNKLDVNAKNKFGVTPLALACQYGKLDAVKTLVENGAIIHLVNEKRETLLHEVSESSNEESVQAIVRFLIDQGIKIEDQDDKGFTALQVACSYSNYNAIKELIDNGANVNVITNSKQTLLHLLTNKLRLNEHYYTTVKDVIKLLIEKGLDINAKDEKGYTPLHQSVFELNYIACIALIECDSNINALTKRNENALHVLLDSTTVYYFIGQDVIKLLTDSRIDVNQVNQNGDTPLQLAVRKGREVYFIEALLENGCDINVKTRQNETLLHLALKNTEADRKTVELLISKCEQLVNAVDNNEVSPLFLACQFRNRFLISLLLEKGATLNHETLNCLIEDFPNILMDGQVKLLRFLFENSSYLGELNTKIEEFPADLPLHLAKRNGFLQADLLLEMAGYIQELREKNPFVWKDNIVNCIIRKFQNSSSNSDCLPNTSS